MSLSWRRFCVLACLCALASTGLAAEDSMRVLSWNVSEDAFVAEKASFDKLIGWARPDILLLDEVDPTADEKDLLSSLGTLSYVAPQEWAISYGLSGGRQRGVIASRFPLEAVPEFSSVIHYPEADRDALRERMSARELAYSNFSMAGGIPVNGAIVLTGDRRLLTVVADLQSGGADQDSWQEYRRRVEAREIRRLIARVLERTSVDGIIVAGDLNMVNGPLPLIMLSEPGLPGWDGLVAAELYHPNSSLAWTWDGRETPFPSGTLDFQLYEPRSLEVLSGFILDTEFLDESTYRIHKLEASTSARTGRHRPLLAEYAWKKR